MHNVLQVQCIDIGESLSPSIHIFSVEHSSNTALGDWAEPIEAFKLENLEHKLHRRQQDALLTEVGRSQPRLC